jgi:hypothetical protein
MRALGIVSRPLLLLAHAARTARPQRSQQPRQVDSQRIRDQRCILHPIHEPTQTARLWRGRSQLNDA